MKNYIVFNPWSESGLIQGDAGIICYYVRTDVHLEVQCLYDAERADLCFVDERGLKWRWRW